MKIHYLLLWLLSACKCSVLNANEILIEKFKLDCYTFGEGRTKCPPFQGNYSRLTHVSLLSLQTLIIARM